MARYSNPMMRRLFLIFATVTAAGWCQSVEHAKISFLVVNEAGIVLRDWKVTTFKTDKTDVAAQFTGLTASAIPTGVYEYVLSGPPVKRRSGARDWTPTVYGKIPLYRPAAFVVRTATEDQLIGGALDRALPPGFVIRGKIEPMPPPSENGDPVRVQVHHLNPWGDINAIVDDTGEFRIYDAPLGRCIVTVIRGPEVLHVQPVFFDESIDPMPFVLHISDKPLPMMHVK